MKKTLFVIVLYAIIVSVTSGQTPTGETWPLQKPDDLLGIDEMLKDDDFVKIYEQMSGQKLNRDTSLPTTQFSPLQAVAEVPAYAPPASVPTQNPLRPLLDIAVQQLAQLDGHKNVLLQNMRNAETCGYRSAGYVAADENWQTDFESRRYVPSRSLFDWAIHGDGFFVLHIQRGPFDTDKSTQPDESDTYYTRAGRFELTDDRKLCIKHGGETYLLQPEIEVAKEGDLNHTVWQLARFKHPERLLRLDGVMFQVDPDGEKPVMFCPSEASGSTIRTQEYESSNVDVAETWRIYRALHKMQSAILDSAAF